MWQECAILAIVVVLIILIIYNPQKELMTARMTAPEIIHMKYYHIPQYVSGDQIAGRKSGRMNIPVHRVVMPASTKGEFMGDFNQLHFK